MQALYTLDAFDAFDFKNHQELKTKALILLNNNFHAADELFNMNMLYITKIAQYAEVDARFRSSKYLPSPEDMNVNTKIAGNTFLWGLLEDASFREKVVEDKLESKIENDRVKRMYQSLVKTEAYLNYIAENSRDDKSEKAIIYHIFKEEMLNNEEFQEYLNDTFDGWEDDKDLIIMLVKNYFSNNRKINFLQFISTEKKEYAIELIHTVLDKDDFLMELINPKLKNWDAERVATIDLILLKMGLAELLYFPSIPTNVTINEYIEVAKNYSTPQSGQFVNGVLDGLMKELKAENKIRKIERNK